MSIKRSVVKAVSVVLLSVGVCSAGCDSRTTAAPRQTNSPVSDQKASFASYNLTLYGYNYTDTEIGSFEVNRQGGGNVPVSSPTAGGGSGACCIAVYSPILFEVPVIVKWSRDGDTWCEQSVLIQPPLPVKPEYLEIHFYRDGHIEAAITGSVSAPRLQLEREHGNSRFSDKSKNMNNDSRFAKCRMGYR